MMAGKLSWVSAKSVEISLGEDTFSMVATGCNRPVVGHKSKLSTYKEECHGMRLKLGAYFMPRPWRFHERQSGLVMLTGNMPNWHVTLVTCVNGCVTLVTCVT